MSLDQPAPPLIVYLHGVPGTSAELALWDGIAKLGPTVFAPDRHAIDPRLDADAMFDLLAREIATRADTRPIHLIGFSLGAFAALQIASRLRARIARLDLISAAAPLALGDFLPSMAGRQVFGMARVGGWKFQAAVRVQAALGRRAPSLMTAMLFASAVPADNRLFAQNGVKARYRQMLRASFTDGGSSYRREICAYVQPWAHSLAHVTAPAVLWHGSADNWTPIGMAEALVAVLPVPSRIERLEGQSHYSAMAAALAALAETSG